MHTNNAIYINLIKSIINIDLLNKHDLTSTKKLKHVKPYFTHNA